MTTGPNADPARDSSTPVDGEGDGRVGRIAQPSRIPPGGSSSSSGNDNIVARAAEGNADQQRLESGESGNGATTTTTTTGNTEEDKGEGSVPAPLPGHARAWFSLPADGVLDSFLLLQYLRSVLCADGLMKVLHCAAEQQQRPAGLHSPPPPPSSHAQSPDPDHRRQPQLQPPPLDVSFNSRGYQRRSTSYSPLARSYSHGSPSSASGAASVGGGTRGSSGVGGEQTSVAAAAVVAAAVGEALVLVGTPAVSHRHSSGGISRRATFGAIPGTAIATARSINDLDLSGRSTSTVRGILADEGEVEPSPMASATSPTKASEAGSNDKARVFATTATVLAKAKEEGQTAYEPGRQRAVGSSMKRDDGNNLTYAHGQAGTGVDGGGERSGATADPELVEDVDIDQADLNFVYSSWQATVPRSDPAAKRTVSAARKVLAYVIVVSKWHDTHDCFSLH